MLPLKDINPTRRFPVLTYVLIAINVLVFLWELRFSPEQLDAVLSNLAVVPAAASAHPFALPTILSILRSMFFHGGWTHLLGNMLYLYLFGDNVEDRLGWIMYLVLYFGSGFAAGWAQIAIDPASTIVLVGASGAIAGVLGSYFLFFPRVRVKGIVPLAIIAFWADWPAWLVIGLWFLVQLFNGVTSLGVPMSGGGVAFFAHIGGFVFGMLLTRLTMMAYPQLPAPDREEMLYRRSGRYSGF
jgi:membrane associated rhomboid family serine protease